jgi:cytochrome c oxidase assembly protein subunit 15
MTVQFQHRMLAYLICGLVLWQAVALNRAGPAAPARRATGLAILVFAQAAIGITTLLLVVPLWAALLHQAVAVALLAAATVNARAAADCSPAAASQAAAPRP